ATLAEQWLLKAANAGYADAYEELGGFYYYGKGRPADYKKALYWYQKAVENASDDNFILSYFGYGNIASMYYEGGHGISKNLRKAREWYRKAADAGESESIYKYAVMCYKGEGDSEDYVEAEKYFLKLVEEDKPVF